jgi:uncharacterized membrane protein
MAGERKAKAREEHEIEFSRIVAFSDGVFAIAITLLVLGIDVPRNLSSSELTSEILNQWDNLLAYGISFAVIGRFWILHHRFFGEVRAFDGKLMTLNLLYLAWIVLIPFSSKVLGDYSGHTASLIVYAGNLIGVVLVGMWMVADAQRAGLTRMNEREAVERRIRSLYLVAVFAVSIPVAFVLPNLASLLWLALFLDPADRVMARRDARDPPS